jgi:hypothetical protein
MKSDTNRKPTASAPTCWQREAPCACVRIESSAREAHVFPYQHLVTASLCRTDDSEVLRLSFSSHDVEISGSNLRPLLLAVQDFAVKWIRTIPERYHHLAIDKNGIIASIRIEEAN